MNFSPCSKRLCLPRYWDDDVYLSNYYLSPAFAPASALIPVPSSLTRTISRRDLRDVYRLLSPLLCLVPPFLIRASAWAAHIDVSARTATTLVCHLLMSPPVIVLSPMTFLVSHASCLPLTVLLLYPCVTPYFFLCHHVLCGHRDVSL